MLRNFIRKCKCQRLFANKLSESLTKNDKRWLSSNVNIFDRIVKQMHKEYAAQK